MPTERARRHRGEGGIYQRKDGRWVGAIDLGKVGGKRVRKTVTAPTLKELRPKFRKLQQQVQAGVLTDDMSVAEWMEHWLDLVAVERVRPTTMRTYRSKNRTWVVPHLGNIRLDRLRPDHIRALYATMREEGKSDSTRHHVHSMLSRALKVAERDGRIPFNPAERIDPPALGTNTRGKLTLPEARAVLGALDGGQEAARWTLALLAGLRQGEALGLRWEDVDLEAGVIHVRQAAQRLGGQGIVVAPLKSRSSERDIPMVTPVRFALAHTEGERTGFVFGGDKPLDAKKDWEAWRDLLAKAKVPHRPPHAARATTASLLDEAGVSPKIIAEIMGHAQVAVTQKSYISGDERVHANAMGALEALVLGESGTH